MNLQWFDLLQFTIMILSILCIVKFKSKWRFVPIGILVLTYLFNPINITNKNATKRFITNPQHIEKIEVNRESFEKRQQGKYNKLKQESKEKLNEEIN